MKFGKAKLKRTLSKETGIPIKDITIHGRYEYFGNKERLVIGSHTITAVNNRVFLRSPVIRDDEIEYEIREIKSAPLTRRQPRGTQVTNQPNHSIRRCKCT